MEFASTSVANIRPSFFSMTCGLRKKVFRCHGQGNCFAPFYGKSIPTKGISKGGTAPCIAILFAITKQFYVTLPSTRCLAVGHIANKIHAF